MRLDGVKSGDAVEIIGGTYVNYSGKFVRWPKLGKLSAYVVLDKDSTQHRCIRTKNVNFVGTTNSTTKKKRAPHDVDIENMWSNDSYGTNATNNREEEKINALISTISALTIAVTDLNKSVAAMSDRISTLENEVFKKKTK